MGARAGTPEGARAGTNAPVGTKVAPTAKSEEGVDIGREARAVKAACGTSVTPPGI